MSEGYLYPWVDFFYLENSIRGDGSVVGCSTSPRAIIIILWDLKNNLMSPK
jgi:hypothetical protein